MMCDLPQNGNWYIHPIVYIFPRTFCKHSLPPSIPSPAKPHPSNHQMPSTTPSSSFATLTTFLTLSSPPFTSTSTLKSPKALIRSPSTLSSSSGRILTSSGPRTTREASLLLLLLSSLALGSRSLLDSSLSVVEVEEEMEALVLRICWR